LIEDEQESRLASQVREFCKSAAITIMAWGPDTLVVKAKPPEIATQNLSSAQTVGI